MADVIPLCEPQGIDGWDITALQVIEIGNLQGNSALTVNGGYWNPISIRFQIVNSSGFVVHDASIGRFGQTFKLYSNCDAIPAIIGGPDENLSARYVVPAEGKLVLLNIAASQQLFGSSTCVGFGVKMSRYDCENKFISSIAPPGRPDLVFFRGGPGLWTYMIFGSCLYGRNPRTFHHHSMTFLDGGYLVYFDETAAQIYPWESVTLTVLTADQKERLRWLSYYFDMSAFVDD